jgi:hypothetical protein
MWDMMKHDSDLQQMTEEDGVLGILVVDLGVAYDQGLWVKGSLLRLGKVF